MLKESRAINIYLKQAFGILTAGFLVIYNACADDVVFVLSKDARPYQQFVESVRYSLNKTDAGKAITTNTILLSNITKISSNDRVIIAVGTK